MLNTIQFNKLEAIVPVQEVEVLPGVIQLGMF